MSLKHSNKIIELTPRQIREIRSIATQNIEWAKASTNVGRFIERYVVIETLARRLIAIKSGKPCPHTLNFTSIRSAIRYFGLSNRITDRIVEDIFRSEGHNGPLKTPRQLRNLIIHGLSSAACHTVNANAVRYMKTMEIFLKEFSS